MNCKSLIMTTALSMMFVSGCSQAPEPETQAEIAVEPERVVTVSGERITPDDLAWYLESRSSGPVAQDYDATVRDRLDELILTRVLAQEARRRNLDESPALKHAINQMLGQKLITEQVIQPVMQREIRREEIEAYYEKHKNVYAISEQVRLAEVFIAAPETGSAEQRESKRLEAEALLAEAQKVQDERFGFSNLIRTHSDKHPIYAKGDTGYFDVEGRPIGLEAALVRTAFSLPELGKVHDRVVATADGYHIVMLVGKRPAMKKELDDVAAEIEQRIRREEIERKKAKLIKNLLAGKKIKIFDEKVREVTAKTRPVSQDTKGKTDKRDAGAFPLQSMK